LIKRFKSFDNRLENLRVVTQKVNAQNKKISSANKSGVTGVCIHKSNPIMLLTKSFAQEYDNLLKYLALITPNFGHGAGRLTVQSRMTTTI